MRMEIRLRNRKDAISFRIHAVGPQTLLLHTDDNRPINTYLTDVAPEPDP